MMTLRTSNLFVLAIISCLFIAVTSSEAIDKKEEQRWVSIFPIGTEIHSFAIDPQGNTLYATNPKGLFKSVNEGRFWFLVTGFKSGQDSSRSIIKISPFSPKTLYWGTFGVWRSRDGGITWEDISAGVIRNQVYGIALHPKSPEIIYVASEGGLYKTLNGGKTWGKIAGKAYSVFLNPKSPDEIYASIEGKYEYSMYGAWLLYSKDGGQNFDRIKVDKLTRFGEKKCGEDVHDTAFALLNLTDTEKMLASCNHGGGGQSILKSSDSGKTWEFVKWINFVVPEKKYYTGGKVTNWSFHPKDKNVIYFVVEIWGDEKATKILKSTDGGKTWTPLSSPPSKNIGNIEIPFPDAIYATTDYGIYKTTDDGKTWEPRSFGLPVKIGDRELKWVDAKLGIIYVGSINGYWTSDDKGLSWKWLPFPKAFLLSYPRATALQTFVTTDQTIWELIRESVGIGITSRWQILKTVARQKPIKIETEYSPRQFAVSLSSSNIIYLSAIEDNTLSQSEQYGELLLRSEDAGFSWTQIDWQRSLQMEQGRYRHKVILLSVDSRYPNTLFTGIRHSTKGMGDSEPSRTFSLLKTTDGGKTWADLSRGLYESVESVWSSSKWLSSKERHHVANRLLSSSTSIAIDQSNRVYIITSGGGVYRSDDGGKTWKPKSPVNYLKTLVGVFDDYSAQQCKGRKNCKIALDVALPQSIKEVGFSFNDIAINPSKFETVYLATNKGIYRSTDHSDTWHVVNHGLLDTSIKKVMVSPSLVLAEGENGIYKLSE